MWGGPLPCGCSTRPRCVFVEPTTGIEPVNLFLTKEVLYLLSYVGSGPQQSNRQRVRAATSIPIGEFSARTKFWSGKRDSNPRRSAWKADALPTELFPPDLGVFPPKGGLYGGGGRI